MFVPPWVLIILVIGCMYVIYRKFQDNKKINQEIDKENIAKSNLKSEYLDVAKPKWEVLDKYLFGLTTELNFEKMTMNIITSNPSNTKFYKYSLKKDQEIWYTELVEVFEENNGGDRIQREVNEKEKAMTQINDEAFVQKIETHYQKYQNFIAKYGHFTK